MNMMIQRDASKKKESPRNLGRGLKSLIEERDASDCTDLFEAADERPAEQVKLS